MSKRQPEPWWNHTSVCETVKYLWGYRCSICGRNKHLTIHHIKPRWKAGENWEPKNLAPICLTCHVEIQPTVDLPHGKWTNLLWKGQAHSSPFSVSLISENTQGLSEGKRHERHYN